jgi:hypothetical protein
MNWGFWATEMGRLSESARYEIKIPIYDLPVHQIKRWVNLHPVAFRQTFPPRKVNNIYFDTPDNQSFQEHLDGVYERHKLRVRWYGSKVKFVQSQLEIKKRYGDLGKKFIHPVDVEIDLQHLSWPEISKRIQINLPPGLSELIAASRPVMINSYHREYFQTANAAIRLTIDYQHHSFDQRFSSIPNCSFREPFHDVSIIEIKAPSQAYKSAIQILAHFPLRANQFSKFIDGRLSAERR